MFDRKGRSVSKGQFTPLKVQDLVFDPLSFLSLSRASVSQGDQGIKNPRAKALWDKWRHVWMMAWERDRRLKEKLGYLQELEKVKNRSQL